MAMLKGGLIQMGLKGDTDMSPADITKAMIEAHISHELDVHATDGSIGFTGPESRGL